MEQMKVVHIGSGHPARHIRIHQKECRSLAAAGYDVSYIAVHDRSEVIDDVKIIPVRAPRNRFDRLLVWPWLVLRRAVRCKAAIYHIHNPSLLPIGRVLAANGAAVVYDMHENTPKWLLTAPWLPLPLRRPTSLLYSMIERLALRGMPVVFAENSYAADYPWVRTSTTVLNMPETQHLLNVQARKRAEYSTVYFGIVQADRGTLTTIKALRILQQRGKSVSWVCIGDTTNSHHRELTKLAESCQVSDKVSLHGWVAPAEGWSIVASCHVGLALLSPVPNYIDSYPTKIFEYMGLGLPVITSNFALYRSVVEQCRCGLCVDPENPVEIADAIEWLLDNPDSAREMGANGRRAVIESYGWLAEARKLLDFYKAIRQSATAQIPRGSVAAGDSNDQHQDN